MVQATFDVLGPLRVVIDGVDVTPQAPRERSLLTLLIVHHGQVVHADRLLDELWGDLDVDRARRSLWVRIAGVRARFRLAGAEGLLEQVDRGYRLTVLPEQIDAERFARLVSSARPWLTADPPGAVDRLQQALALWRGDALQDAQGGTGLEAEAERLTEARLGAVEDWAECQLACGRHLAVLDELERWTTAHPWRERLARQHIAALRLAGRRYEALQAVRELERRFVEELEVEAPSELIELERDLLRPARAPSVPVGFTSFVGRRAELDELSELLASSRLITLTGTGGVGKSRLAAEACSRLADRFDDGVRFVELAPVSSDDAVAGAVAGTLGLLLETCDGPGGVLDSVIERLAGRHLLLVLDNAEHVVAGTVRFVHGLLCASSDVTVLVTSRAVLHLPGEVVVPVGPLAVLDETNPGRSADEHRGDAVELFAERARAASGGRWVAPQDLPLVARICRRLDGIPLAIELAAAQVRVLGIDFLAERLDQHFEVLGASAPVGVPERHRTLGRTQDWSYDLLGDEEQAAFRRLSVFPGSFDVHAALGVLDGGAAALGVPDGAGAALGVLDAEAPTSAGIDREGCVPAPIEGGGGPAGLVLLSRLVDQSLVEVVGGRSTRYRLLEPVKRYAAQKLEQSGELEMTRDRHAAVFVRRSEARWPLIPAADRERAYVDRDDLRQALDWAWQRGDALSALDLVTIQVSTWIWPAEVECRSWLERVLAAPGLQDQPGRARAMSVLALTLHDSGGCDRARIDALLAEAARLAARSGDPILVTECVMVRVEVEMARGDLASARASLDAALARYEELGARTGLGWCCHYLGWIALRQGDLVSALEQFERTRILAEGPVGDRWLLPHALADLALVLSRLGERERATEVAEAAVAAARGFTVRAVLVMALARAAEVALTVDDLPRARRTTEELLSLLMELGTRRWVGEALAFVSAVLERQGETVPVLAADPSDPQVALPAALVALTSPRPGRRRGQAGNGQVPRSGVSLR